MARMPHFGLGQAPTEGAPVTSTYTARDPSSPSGFMGLTIGQALALTYEDWLPLQQQMTPNSQFWNQATWLTQRCSWLGLPATAIAQAAASAPSSPAFPSGGGSSSAQPSTAAPSPTPAGYQLTTSVLQPAATFPSVAAAQPSTASGTQASAAAQSTSWFSGSTNLFGTTIQNSILALLAGAAAIGLYMFSGKKKA